MAVARSGATDSISIFGDVFSAADRDRVGDEQALQRRDAFSRSTARPDSTGWTTAADTDVAPLARRKSVALKMVPPVAISSSTSRQSLPLMSPMTCAGLRLLVVAGAALVDEGHRQIEPLGEAAGVLGLADVGGDDHGVR